MKKIIKPAIKLMIKPLLILLVLGLIGITVFMIINVYIDKYAEKYCEKDLSILPNADAIMVLGAFVYENGYPSEVLADRLDKALELYNTGKAPKIILSGDHGTKEYDEVNVMKDYLMEKGIPRDDLFMDHAGFNTYDSMYRAKEIFGVKTLIVTTQKFHINRSVYIARKLGIDAYGYPDDKWINYYNRSYGIREKLAKIKAFIDVEITKRKPKYLGDPISLDGSGTVTDG